MMDIDSQPPFIVSVFTRPPIYDRIFDSLSAVSLLRTARTARIIHEAYNDYKPRAFSINRHLSRFFNDPLGFRSLQAQTSTLISGSNALQFFDRSFYPESDLDLYTYPHDARTLGLWLMEHEGYAFVPNSNQNADFLAASWFKADLVDTVMPTAVDAFHAQHYRIAGIAAIYSFERAGALKVQIIVAQHTPLECILNFHSTCVMNVISADAAHALYPRATLEHRRALAFPGLSTRDAAAVSKYAARGWRMLANMWPRILRADAALFAVGAERWPDDAHAWTIPLDCTGVAPRVPLSATSVPLTQDPVVCNSWRIEWDRGSQEMRMTHRMVKPTTFRYQYLAADMNFIDFLLPFFISQGTLEHLRVSFMTSEEKQQAWTWWDAALPGLREEYLSKKAAKAVMNAEARKA